MQCLGRAALCWAYKGTGSGDEVTRRPNVTGHTVAEAGLSSGFLTPAGRGRAPGATLLPAYQLLFSLDSNPLEGTVRVFLGA